LQSNKYIKYLAKARQNPLQTRVVLSVSIHVETLAQELQGLFAAIGNTLMNFATSFWPEDGRGIGSLLNIQHIRSTQGCTNVDPSQTTDFLISGGAA